ncbi:MAG: hypothetical protein Q6373_010990 [Candidatus Sigynarchaeota archaeon]
MLAIDTLNLFQHASAQSPGQEKVPTPNIMQIHHYNNDAGNEFQHEYWSLTMRCGDTLLNLIADNATRKSEARVSVTYQQNTQYFVGGINYIASLQIVDIAFVIGNQTVATNLTNCAGFVLTYTPVTYNGPVPGFDCNITFDHVQVYPGTGRDSTFDLSVIHHVNVDWTRSTIITEALFNFTNTRLYGSNGSEFAPATPFCTEIHYGMSLNDQTHDIGIAPSGHTDTRLEYNITRENGAPLNVARLNMNNNFTVRNASGSFGQIGYSSMAVGPQSATATHGFPGLQYKNVASIKSDPDLQVTYDRIGVPLDPLAIALIILAAGAAAATCVILVTRWRKMRARTRSITR